VLLDENEMAEIKAAKEQAKAQKKAKNAIKRIDQLQIVQQNNNEDTAE